MAEAATGALDGSRPHEPARTQELASAMAGLQAESAPWIAIFPGIAISLAVFGFSLFGDAVRDELDPTLRAR